MINIMFSGVRKKRREIEQQKSLRFVSFELVCNCAYFKGRSARTLDFVESCGSTKYDLIRSGDK